MDFLQGQKHFCVHMIKVKNLFWTNYITSSLSGEKNQAISSEYSIVLHLDTSSLRHFPRLLVIKNICHPVHVQ